MDTHVEEAIRRNAQQAVRDAHQTLAVSSALECAARHLLRAQAALQEALRRAESPATTRALELTDEAIACVIERGA